MRTPAPLTAQDPTHAGRFRLLGRLAAGGMGIVYLARQDDRPDSLVAVKMMRPETVNDPLLRDRFAQEIAASRRLCEKDADSTHVARAVDADATGSRLWLATEFVPGPSLAEEVATRPMSDARVLDVATALAAAVVALHDVGIVHGDLKPTNVVLGPDGLRLVDLGLARENAVAVEHGPGVDLDMRAPRTAAGGAMRFGSPGWSPPEFGGTSPLGPAVDVHGWGMTVAFASNGRPAYGAGTLSDVHHRMRTSPPDLDGVPTPLLPLVRAALEPDPARRPSAVDLLARMNSLKALAANDTQPLAAVVGGTEAHGRTAAIVSPTLLESLPVQVDRSQRRTLLPALVVAAVTIAMLAISGVALGLIGGGAQTSGTIPPAAASTSAVTAPKPSGAPATPTPAPASATSAAAAPSSAGQGGGTGQGNDAKDQGKGPKKPRGKG